MPRPKVVSKIRAKVVCPRNWRGSGQTTCGCVVRRRQQLLVVFPRRRALVVFLAIKTRFLVFCVHIRPRKVPSVRNVQFWWCRFCTVRFVYLACFPKRLYQMYSRRVFSGKRARYTFCTVGVFPPKIPSSVRCV